LQDFTSTALAIAGPPKASAATTSIRIPITKRMTPNGIAKHAFLNLAVKHPSKPVKRNKTPKPMNAIVMAPPPNIEAGILKLSKSSVTYFGIKLLA